MSGIALFFVFGILAFVADCYDYCQAPPVVPSQNTQGYSLQTVQILTRHGDRTPTWAFQNEVEWDCTLNWLNLPSNEFTDSEYVPKRLYRKTFLPNRNVLPGDCMLGQLTDKGLQQHLSLGGQFRDLYVEKYQFLPNNLSLSDIWVRSTDIPRTLQSVMGNLWALWPPETRPGGNITTIDINTMDIEMDDMTPNTGICPRLQQIYDDLENATLSPEWRNFTDTYMPLQEQIMALLNITKKKDFPGWTNLWDNLGARTCHNKSLWPFNEELVQQIYEPAEWHLAYRYSNSESGKLGSGGILKELRDRFAEFTNGSVNTQLFFYSGHDTTLGPLMASLGVWRGWPPYASHVEMELWSDQGGQFYVQTKYNGEVILLDGCKDVMCSYDEWLAFVNTRIPDDFALECLDSKNI